MFKVVKIPELFFLWKDRNSSQWKSRTGVVYASSRQRRSCLLACQRIRRYSISSRKWTDSISTAWKLWIQRYWWPLFVSLSRRKCEALPLSHPTSPPSLQLHPLPQHVPPREQNEMLEVVSVNVIVLCAGCFMNDSWQWNIALGFRGKRQFWMI